MLGSHLSVSGCLSEYPGGKKRKKQTQKEKASPAVSLAPRSVQMDHGCCSTSQDDIESTVHLIALSNVHISRASWESRGTAKTRFTYRTKNKRKKEAEVWSVQCCVYCNGQYDCLFKQTCCNATEPRNQTQRRADTHSPRTPLSRWNLVFLFLPMEAGNEELRQEHRKTNQTAA